MEVVESDTQPQKPPSNRWRKTLFSGVISGLGAGVVLGVIFFITQTIHVAPVRLPSIAYDIAYPVSWFVLFGTPLVILGTAFGVLATIWFREVRTVAVALAVFVVLFTPTMFLAFRAAFAAWDYAFVALAERSKPLTTAIEKFETEKGRPPQTLRELVPEYIAEIPWTGLGSSPTYDYRTPPSGDFLMGTWYLGVDVSDFGLMDWDTFVYDPEHHYEGSNGYDYFERFGDWVYRHD